MKKTICLFLGLLAACALSAAPFGLKMGMTISEVEDASSGVPLKPARQRDNLYAFEPAKRHPLFTSYFVLIDEKVGLYGVIASSDIIKMDDYGTQLKEAFNDAMQRVSKAYGTPRLIDVLAPDAHFDDDKFWAMSFRQGARTLKCEWPRTAKDEMKDDLLKVVLATKPEGYFYEGVIELSYSFTNSASVEDEEDDVF